MSRIHNRSDMKQRRRQLRKRATPQEKRLYEALRGRKVADAKFRFNPSIAHYVVDFYCPAHRIVVELDGSQHLSEQGLGDDEVRTAFLASLGIRVLRFANSEVDNELETVIDKIRTVIVQGR